jgi:hypothetical protein
MAAIKKLPTSKIKLTLTHDEMQELEIHLAQALADVGSVFGQKNVYNILLATLLLAVLIKVRTALFMQKNQYVLQLKAEQAAGLFLLYEEGVLAAKQSRYGQVVLQNIFTQLHKIL